MAGLWDTLMQAGQGFSNGAQSFADQARWTAGSYGNAPMPAPYTGGPDYPAKDDANAYVRNNYPSDGVNALSVTRPETMYTPLGMKPPPGGREPTVGEMHQGAPTARQVAPWVAEFLEKFEKLNRGR